MSPLSLGGWDPCQLLAAGFAIASGLLAAATARIVLLENQLRWLRQGAGQTQGGDTGLPFALSVNTAISNTVQTFGYAEGTHSIPAHALASISPARERRLETVTPAAASHPAATTTLPALSQADHANAGPRFHGIAGERDRSPRFAPGTVQVSRQIPSGTAPVSNRDDVAPSWRHTHGTPGAPADRQAFRPSRSVPPIIAELLAEEPWLLAQHRLPPTR